MGRKRNPRGRARAEADAEAEQERWERAFDYAQTRNIAMTRKLLADLLDEKVTHPNKERDAWIARKMQEEKDKKTLWAAARLLLRKVLLLGG